jgi:ATP-dependent protease HslVU (ClpYQ) peptidase subunit
LVSNEETGGSFLVGYKGRLFQIYGDYQVGESVINYASVGCGDNYALGAMNILTEQVLCSKDILIKALETAVKFSNGVEPPFNFAETK